MDDLHTLAVDVARRVLESDSEDPDIRELARLLLEEARIAAGSPTLDSQPGPGPL